MCLVEHESDIFDGLSIEFREISTADEILSDGYTVGDYRKDYTLADSTRELINNLYKSDSDEERKAIIDSIEAIIDKIKSNNCKDKVKTELDKAVKAIAEREEAAENNEPSENQETDEKSGVHNQLQNSSSENEKNQDNEQEEVDLGGVNEQ